uniref:Uncharacterized protein n=1 Tax=Cacopsylla melanoneura TaxID=428564 RepID=A0A8D8Q0H6_9HEMI
MKLFLDFSLGGWLRWPYRGCLLSLCCFQHSISAATLRRTCGGANPASGYSLCTGVGLRHPVTILAVSLTAISTSLAWHEFFHTGAAYSAAEMLRARADVRSTWGFAPHEVPVIFRRMLFRALTFCFVPMQ